jgi:hypothetical protein
MTVRSERILSGPSRSFHEHMFPPMTTRRPKKLSLREKMREAVGTAVELATLGEATLFAPDRREERSAPTHEHPHRRPLRGHHPRTRRPGTVSPRAQVCVSPVHRPARRA